MAQTLAEVIRETTRDHLKHKRGLLFGQCVTAVGWIGGTVPEMTEEEGIVELSMADVAGAGVAVGAALVGGRPIYVIRYQGFMWYNAAPLLNYAAKSKDMWGVPCPLLVRAIAMEGSIGPVASGSHHGMVARMPGMPICAPMTPGEWREGWQWYLQHDDPMYMSEHRRGFTVDYEMPDQVSGRAKVTLIAISAARLNAVVARQQLAAQGIDCDLVHCVWLKPFHIKDAMLASLKQTGLGIVIDSDFEIAAVGRSIAYELMHATKKPVFAMGIEDRSAGFSKTADNLTPSPEKIAERVRELLK